MLRRNRLTSHSSGRLRRRLIQALGAMFRLLQFWWVTKRSQIIGGVVVLLMFAGFVLFIVVPTGQPLAAAEVKGIVVSAGPLPELGFCPDPNQIASVRLANGRIIHAHVATAQTLQPGTSVWVRQWRTACNSDGYEVVLPR